MLGDQSESDRQLAAIYALDAKLGPKKRKQRENWKSKKKMKGLELDAKSLSGLDKIPEGSDLTRHVNFVGLPEVDPHKTDGSGDRHSTPLITGAPSGDGSKVSEEYNNGERENMSIRSDGGINGGNYVYRTKAEEYKMVAEFDQSEKDQLAAIYAFDARLRERNKKIREKKKSKKKMKDLEPDAQILSGLDITPEGKGSMHVISVTLPDTNEAQSGDCSRAAEEYRNGENTNTGVRSDVINRDNDAYQTISMLASEDRMKKSAKLIEKNASEKTQQLTYSPTVAYVADEQRESILKDLGATEEGSTSDGLRSFIVIDPGLSFLEGHEETACLGNSRGNPEIEKTEAPVREEEKVFDRRDGGDIAAEIVKHGDSIKAAESTPSLKLGSMKREDNFMLRKLLRKPRYYDFPNSSLQMCHICGEDDHKAADCTMARRKKPCYLCGGFSHTTKRCSQGRECFKCGGRGHLARDCLEEPSSDTMLDFCLRCGDSGHHMFICQSDYSSEDLKAIQCYVCKEFGHLCCVSVEHEGQTVASCYKCGQSGHLGSECTRQETSTNSLAYFKKRKRKRNSLTKSFYNHEAKGQFAGKNGEHNKAGKCTHESTTIGRSFADNEIIPNFAHVPLKSGQGVPSNQEQKGKNNMSPVSQLKY